MYRVKSEGVYGGLIPYYFIYNPACMCTCTLEVESGGVLMGIWYLVLGYWLLVLGLLQVNIFQYHLIGYTLGRCLLGGGTVV